LQCRRLWSGEFIAPALRCKSVALRILPYAVFLFRPLLRSRSNEHHYVNHLGWVRSIASRQHHLDNQQSSTRVHSVPTVLQDRETLVIRPIADDVREKIRIAASWNCLEEIAYLDRDAVRQTAGLNQRRSVPNDMREVVENAA
jgi:hypothetical protein